MPRRVVLPFLLLVLTAFTGVAAACGGDEQAASQDVDTLLRQTFASILISQGHDVVFVSRQLGHANPAITLKVYAHLFDAARHAERARARLDEEYRGLLLQRPNAVWSSSHAAP